MLNIVVPMAGRGARFQEAGYRLPKPLIPVHGIPMIEVVIRNLSPRRPHRFTFICQREHVEAFGLKKFLHQLTPGSKILTVERVTEGAACTVLLARDVIDGDQPLMIANCDQWIDASIDEYLAAGDRFQTSGFLMTMSSDNPKWSYVRRGSEGNVVGVVEKQVVSSEATVGIYNFARGSEFVRAADAMIAANARVNNEFYVAPTYSWLIQWGGTVETFSIGSDVSGMHGLGTPEDLERFLGRGFEARMRERDYRSAKKAA
jgi:dTDP-glucose pyrophosphorylase